MNAILTTMSYPLNVFFEKCILYYEHLNNPQQIPTCTSPRCLQMCCNAYLCHSRCMLCWCTEMCQHMEAASMEGWWEIQGWVGSRRRSWDLAICQNWSFEWCRTAFSYLCLLGSVPSPDAVQIQVEPLGLLQPYPGVRRKVFLCSVVARQQPQRYAGCSAGMSGLHSQSDILFSRFLVCHTLFSLKQEFIK